ncbi:uncharacterized protein LOC111126653 [Crassostrea virginica]
MCFKWILQLHVVIVTVSFSAGQVLGQCNLDGARDCLANVTIPNLGTKDLKEACQAYKTVDSCMAPYQTPCEQDPAYQEMISGFSAIQVFCVGDENCDPTKCYQIIGIDITGSSQQSPEPADKCTKFPDFKNCVDTQRPACEGNIMFTMLEEAYVQLETACTGGTVFDSNTCDIQGFGNCMKKLGINLETPGNEYACEIVDSVASCVSTYGQECGDHPVFSMVLPGIQQTQKVCQLACKIDGCLESLKFPSDNCTNLQNAITCIEVKKNDCADDTSIQNTLSGIKALCSEASQIEENENMRKCLSEAKINQNCQKILDRMSQNETESTFCQKTAEYSMCAKMSLSNCEDNVEEYITEAAMKLSSLKFLRNAEINCPKSNGPCMSPTIWTIIVCFLLYRKLNSF